MPATGFLLSLELIAELSDPSPLADGELTFDLALGSDGE
jgi:hypothetical protein